MVPCPSCVGVAETHVWGCLVHREVSEREGRALAQKWGCPFVESSAKHNDNIGEAFHRVLVAIHRLEDGDLEDPGCCCSGEARWRASVDGDVARAIRYLTIPTCVLPQYPARVRATSKAQHTTVRCA